MATNSLILHLVAASLWAGGLFALLAHARRRGAYTDVAARRFSAVATVCFVVMAVSGVVNALVRVPIGDLLDTTYGRLVVAKTVALVILGAFGWAQRRRALPALRKDPTSRGNLIRFAGAEAMVFAATIGLAVGLGRTPPPAPTAAPTLTEVELGYNLAGPPTFTRLMLDWRFDLLYGTAAIVLAVVYARGSAQTSPSRRQLAGRPDRRLDVRLRGAADRDVLGCRSLLAGRVQRAHGRPYGAVHAGAGSPGAGCSDHTRPARPRSGRQERCAGTAGVDPDRAAQPVLPIHHPPRRRGGVVRRRFLRPVPRRDLRGRGRLPLAHTS